MKGFGGRAESHEHQDLADVREHPAVRRRIETSEFQTYNLFLKEEFKQFCNILLNLLNLSHYVALRISRNFLMLCDVCAISESDSSVLQRVLDCDLSTLETNFCLIYR